MLDKNTFGKSKACEILVDELNKVDTKAQSNITRLLQNFSITLKELHKIDTRIAINLSGLAFNEYKKICERYPTQYKTFLANVIKYKYRIFLQKIEAQKKTEHRKDYKG